MKFKEIVKIINDEGVILKDYTGNEIEKATLDQLLRSVCKKIRSILEERNIEGVKLRSYNQKIYLDSEKYSTYYRNEPSGIVIKVKKEKVDSKYDYFGTTTYYKFKSIEIEKVERYVDGDLKEIETIEDYFKYEEKIYKEKKEHIQNKKEEYYNNIDLSEDEYYALVETIDNIIVNEFTVEEIDQAKKELFFIYRFIDL